jgi:hypothetical protein
MSITDNIPIIGKKKAPKPPQMPGNGQGGYQPPGSGGNGHSGMSVEDMKKIQEMVVQTMDKANARWTTARMSEEQRLEFAKLIYAADRPMMRRLTWRSHFRSQIDAWLYTITYLSNPERYEKEGWGEAVLNEKGERIGWRRQPGDLLPFLLAMEEQVWQSDDGILMKATTTGMMSQLDFDQSAKMESYGSRGR